MKINPVILTMIVLAWIICFDECIFPDGPEYETGDTLWIHETPVQDSMWINKSLAIGNDGAIYYAAGGATINWIPARVFAIDPEDGSLKWKTEAIDHMAISSQIVVGDDGTVYVIGYYTLYAFNPDNGATKWTWRVPENLPHPDIPGGTLFTLGQIGALALTDNGDLILGSIGSGVYSRALYCIDKDTGVKKWHQLKLNGVGIESGISIGPDNTAFYYTETDLDGNGAKDYLLAVNAQNGQLKWATQINSIVAGSNNIAIREDGNLLAAFVPFGENTMYYHIVNSSDGQILWKSTEQAPWHEKWIGPDGTYYGTSNGIKQVDPNSGALSLVQVGDFGAITENNRIVMTYAPTNVSRLGVFYPDGTLDYEVTMNGITGGGTVISGDQVIYSIINEHWAGSYLPTKICAIQGESPLASKGWPKLYHDNRNTSNWRK